MRHRQQTGRGTLESPHAHAFVDNPLCVDRVRLAVTVFGARIERVAHEVQGCLLCEAVASVIGAMAPGETAEELVALRRALRASLGDDSLGPPRRRPSLEMFIPVPDH